MDDEVSRIVERLGTLDDPKTLVGGLIAHAPVGFAIYGIEGRCLFVNQAFRDLFGSEPPPAYNIFADETLLARGFVDFIHRAFAGQTTVLPAQWYDARDLRHVKVDVGRRVAIEVTLFPLVSAGDAIRHIALCFKDVSPELELQAATDALRLSEARYRAQFEIAPEGIVTIDMQTRRLVEVNAHAERLFGYPRDVLFEMDVGALSPPRQPDGRPSEEVALGHMQLALRGERPVFEWYHRSASGKDIPCEIRIVQLPDADHRYCRASIVDITERKQAEAMRSMLEAELRASESNYRAIFENGSDGILVYDLAAGTIVAANPRACEITGFTKDELLASKPADHATDDPQFALDELERRIRRADAGTPQVFEWKGRHRSGRSYWVEVSVRHATILGQRRMVSFMRDISDRKRLEEALHQTEDRLRQAQKMEAIGRLAGGVAHDFNNLLSVILSYSSIALHTMDPRTAAAAGIDEIRIAGERAAKLTKQLLAFSRQQVLQPTVVDLNEVVVDTEGMLRSLIGEDVEIHTVLAPRLGKTKVDPGQIEQVIMNLAVNARDAMPRGGVLTIETSDVDVTAHGLAAGPATAAIEPHVVLTVRDTGVGMDSDLQAHIFEPFFTTKERGRGTGLGLATVLGIVEQSGGHVSVESSVGAGTTFKLFFPRCEDGATGLRVTVPSTRAIRGTETVLLAEDEEQLRILARTILERNGYHVLTRASSIDILTLCEQYQGVIHALLTDVIMPQMNGFELAERVTLMRPQTKVLFMSGYTDRGIVEQGALLEQAEFLDKPITPDLLLKRLREVLDGPDGRAARRDR